MLRSDGLTVIHEAPFSAPDERDLTSSQLPTLRAGGMIRPPHLPSRAPTSDPETDDDTIVDEEEEPAPDAAESDSSSSLSDAISMNDPFQPAPINDDDTISEEGDIPAVNNPPAASRRAPRARGRGPSNRARGARAGRGTFDRTNPSVPPPPRATRSETARSSSHGLTGATPPPASAHTQPRATSRPETRYDPELARRFNEGLEQAFRDNHGLKGRPGVGLGRGYFLVNPFDLTRHGGPWMFSNRTEEGGRVRRAGPESEQRS